MQNLLNKLFGGSSSSAAPHTPALTPAQQEMNSLLETAATALEQGYHETALETYQRGLTLARTLADEAYEEHFLSGMGAAHVSQEKFDEARPLFDRALEIARRLNDRRALARVYNNLGSLHAKRGEWGSAQTYHQQALDAARETGQAEIIALTLENLAKDYLNQANPSYAQHLLKEAVVITQAGGQFHLASRVLGMLAESTLAMGDRQVAQKLFAQAIHLGQQSGQFDQQLRWLQALARLEMDSGNYAQVIDHLMSAENIALRLGNQPPEFFMNSALDLTTAYQMIGNTAQAEEYATRALAQARSTGNAAHEAMALTRLGMAAYAMNALDRAQSFLAEARTYYQNETLTDPDEHVQILLKLGGIALRQKQLDDAQTIAQEALELARTDDSALRQSEALQLLGNLAAAQGERSQALEHWQNALNLLQDNGSPAQIAQLHCDIARERRAGGDFRAALAEYEKAQMRLNHIDHLPTRGLVLSNAATLYTETGDIDTAQAFYDESIEIAQQTGDQRAESLRLGNLGWFYTLTGRFQTAIDKLEKALAISRALDDTLMIAVQSNNLACTYYNLKDYDTARALHKQAVAAATATDAARWLAVFQSDMAETLIALDRLDEAGDLLQSALEKSEAAGDLETLTLVQARQAALEARLGRWDDADQVAQQAEARARKMHYRRGIAGALAARGDAARLRGDLPASQKFYAEAYRLYTILHDPAAKGLIEFLPETA